jgi:hypothetical protein
LVGTYFYQIELGNIIFCDSAEFDLAHWANHIGKDLHRCVNNILFRIFTPNSNA